MKNKLTGFNRSLSAEAETNEHEQMKNRFLSNRQNSCFIIGNLSRSKRLPIAV